jgi:hypothetical protein
MEIRRDISAYLLHCTRGREEDNLEAFEVLKMILHDGFFKATFAPYTTYSTAETRRAVRGPKRAVCFTEQPLGFFWKSVETSRSFKERYTAFAVAIRKDELFNYGGRPVIYAGEETLRELPLGLQYLWVHYNPTAIWDPSREHEVDFTHEREWRACPNAVLNRNLGLSQQDAEIAEIAVPLQLPTKDSQWIHLGPRPEESPRFAILVDSERHRLELEEWIRSTVGRISERGPYWGKYSNALKKAPILSFETINDYGLDLARLARLEDFINDDFTPKTVSL